MPPGAAPYTKTLSALRKNELVRLSNEFRLPTEGSVFVLRNRLRVYLNAHNEVLYRNPRFNALYPKHRRAQHQPAVGPQRALSPAVSVRSFDSWHGIDANRPRSPSFSPHPSRRSRASTPLQSPPQHYDHLPPVSDDGFPFQDRQPLDGRKSFPLYHAVFLLSIGHLPLLLLALPLPCFCGLSNLFFVFIPLRVSCATTTVVCPRPCCCFGTPYLDTGLLCVPYTPPFGFTSGDPCLPLCDR